LRLAEQTGEDAGIEQVSKRHTWSGASASGSGLRPDQEKLPPAVPEW